MVAELISERVFSLSDDIRSVAVLYRGELASVSRPDPGGTNEWDSDRYEEIIVNPTLITLLRQRGNIDCGGMRHIVIHYGNVTQLVHPMNGGHVSVGFALKSNYARTLPKIRKLLRDENLVVENGKRHE